jgi:hypothetical protein
VPEACPDIVLLVEKPGRRADTLRILGNVCLVAGFLITVIGLATDSATVKEYFFAGSLVALGIGFRLEAAIRDRGQGM